MKIKVVVLILLVMVLIGLSYEAYAAEQFRTVTDEGEEFFVKIELLYDQAMQWGRK